ncbi:MAG: hemolysin [Bacteroidetes bacterium GWA2_30_7]|nr:MAG: hemolysin [Bacteroidetes bacterium GWA2_30_7]
MDKVIDPISLELVESELTNEKFIRYSNFGNNEIYIVNAHNSPNLMKEIGRLREISFREAGGGTGKSIDIDEYDTNENPYNQLIVWNPEDKEIIGGYRYKICTKNSIDTNGNVNIATGSLFKFSEKFINEYFPYLIELGRSFVQPKYQSVVSVRKNIFSLDNLWDGLGALVVDNPSVKYFFGKVTMYKSFNTEARDIILYFLKTFCPDKDELVFPKIPLQLITESKKLKQLFKGSNYEENYKILSQSVRSLGENIPPLVNSYMNLSPTMKTFGTSINQIFGGVEETGIMVTINDIYQSKKDRHINSYDVLRTRK